MSIASFDASDFTGSTSTANNSVPSSNTSRWGQKTKFERDVDAAVRRGVSECKNLLHWEVKRLPDPQGGNTWTDAGIKSHRDILTIMSPGKAKCSCEKNACRWAWTGNWNYKGMYQTEYVAAGVEERGVGSVVAGFPAKKVFPLRYSLTPKKFDVLSKRFPEWQFVGAYGGSHDHPVAHTSTRLASERLLDNLPRGTRADPKVYYDLNGNPSANESYMRRHPEIKIVTVVELITPKDYIRKNTKWGPEFNVDGSPRWITTHIRDLPSVLGTQVGDSISGFISIHTAYYYDPSEMINLLSWAKHANLYALMHKFDGSHGLINDGEQEWVKFPFGSQNLVTQTNVVSGEKYQHPDNSWWYNHDSYAVGDLAMAWTTNTLCDESFILTVTYCPGVQARMSTACYQMAGVMGVKTHSTAVAMAQHEIAEAQTVTMKLYGATFTMPIEARNVKLFGDLRRSVIGKARTAPAYKDHVSRAKVMTKDKDIDAQHLADVIRFSFFIDYEDQYGSDSSMFSQAFVRTLMADPMYKSGTGVTSGTLSALTDILMGAAAGRGIAQVVAKGAAAGVRHANRRGLLDTI